MLEVTSKKEIFEALSAIASQNLLTMEELKGILEKAIFKSFHSKFDPDADLELIIDEKSEKFELLNKSKLVVEDKEYAVENRPFEIGLKEAKKIKPDVQVGDLIAEVVDFAEYSKQVSNSIKAMLTQAVKERKKEAIWAKHKALKGEMIDVVVSTISPAGVAFVLEDGTTAYMPSKLRNVKQTLKIGQKVNVYVEDVLKESKDSQIIVSNGSKVLVKRVLEAEVPEIAQGIVEIVAISRIPGERSKVVVKSTNDQVDPVGAVIGSEGSRINAIVSKLEGEKLDVIPWDDDPNRFIANAFAPARIIGIIDKVYEEGELKGQPVPGHKIVIAPDKHQTLAIGRFGSNARLVVELVNSRLDVISYSEAKAKNLDFPWNGNITESEVERLEAGERIGKSKGNNFRGTRTSPQYSPRNSVSANSFDDDIAMFNVTMGDNNSNLNEAKPFDIDESLFSEEELRAMEANFELDDDIPQAVDIDDDSSSLD